MRTKFNKNNVENFKSKTDGADYVELIGRWFYDISKLEIPIQPSAMWGFDAQTVELDIEISSETKKYFINKAKDIGITLEQIWDDALGNYQPDILRGTNDEKI